MGGGTNNTRRNRKAVIEAIPEKRGVVDDWNDLLKEEKMAKFERDTGRCARCRQTLPLTCTGDQPPPDRRVRVSGDLAMRDCCVETPSGS